MDWIIGLQKAIDYIEENLTETIDYEEVAAQSFSSSYHFQRVFSTLCGFTIGEYIRNREHRGTVLLCRLFSYFGKLFAGQSAYLPYGV